MVFGFFRSKSTPKHRNGAKKQVPLARPKSIHYRPCTAQDASEAWNKAKMIFEAESEQLSRDAAIRQARNDQECKRHMEGIQQRMRQQRKALDQELKHHIAIALANLQADRTDVRGFEKARDKLIAKTDVRWQAYLKRQKAEQAKAQRIFFARGEELAASTGAALRRARDKRIRNQRLTY